MISNNQKLLLSIQPEWCEKIASGEKTIEIRKTRPKIDTPFKCYIYCTKNGCFMEKSKTNPAKRINRINKYGGKVIGEFICDKVIKAEKGSYYTLLASETQMDVIDYVNYADEKPVYGWHISNLIIYDKPKELKGFHKICGTQNCKECQFRSYIGDFLECGTRPYRELKRPPQSWCYVESEVRK